MRLSRQQRKKLQDALIDAFPTSASLERMLSYQLDKNLKEIAGERDLQDIVFKLIQAANAEGWVDDLVRKAHESNPGNSLLEAIAEEILPKKVVPDSELPFYEDRNRLLSLMTIIVERQKQNLHKGELINVSMEEQTVLRVLPHGDELYRGSCKSSVETNIVKVFDRADIAGRLLILGKFGSGKTSILKQLLEELILRAKRDSRYPVPVYLRLSSWQERKHKKRDQESFIQWLLVELTNQGIPEATCSQWLKNQKLLPLLDGLDEMRFSSQHECVQAINYFIQGKYQPKYLVICSQTDAYEKIAVAEKLKLNGAFCLKHLEPRQIQTYLKKVECEKLWEIVTCNTELVKVLIKSPLMLSFLVTIYYEDKKKVIDKYKFSASEEGLKKLLFEDYIKQKLNLLVESMPSDFMKQRLTKEKAKYMLIWLAKRLEKDSKVYFFIEDLQPSWLESKSERRIYNIALNSITGLIIGLEYGLIHGWKSTLSTISLGVILGFLIGIIPIGFREIRPVEVFKLPRIQALRHSLNDGLSTVGSIEGLLVGIISESNWKVTDNRIFSQSPSFWLFLQRIRIDIPVSGLLGGLFGVPVGIFTRGLGDSDNVDDRVYVNQGILKSAISAVVFAIIFGLILGIFGGVISLIIRHRVSCDFIKFGTLIGIFIGSFFPGYTCLQHFILRFILYYNGYVPWNYARFLECAREKQLMERAGGRYSFINSLLQEYLAKRELVKRQ